MDQAPDNELCARAMPEPAKPHCQQKIAVGHERAKPVAAKRHIEVVAQPARQRHVPAPPEILQSQGAVGLVEILRKPVAEKVGDTNRNVGISAEIAVDDDGIGVHCQHKIDAAKVGRIDKNRIDEARRDVAGDHHFFDEAAKDQQHALAKQDACRVRRLCQLRKKVMRPHNRPRHKMREEGDVQHQIHQRARGFEHAAIDINDVRQAVKGEKRNGDGQREAG